MLKELLNSFNKLSVFFLKRPSVVVFPICYSFVFHGLSSQARFGGLRENKKSTL